MHDPSKHWANPLEFDYWAKVYSVKVLAKRLRRTPRTIRDWLNGKRPIPAWTVEVLQLTELQREDLHRRLYPMHKRRQLTLFHDAENHSREQQDTHASNGTGGVAT